jgi:hypothetical protein
MGVHLNVVLQRDWNEHGSRAFAFEVLDTLTPLNDPAFDPAVDLRDLEKLWLERLNPFEELGYNKRAK